MSFSEFIKACNASDKVNISHAICSTKDSIIAEYVKPPYEMNSLRLFFSMTKSFASLAIGIAIDLGFFQIDDKITKFFADDLPLNAHENLEKITIRHLLTMSSGIHYNTYSELFIKRNWISAFLAQEFQHDPGTYYRYSTHGSHVLSAIITKSTSLSMGDFLNKYLFYPMEIYEAQWELSPEKLTAGGMGLSLYPYSLVKISQLLLNNGVFNGKQLISKEYLDMATVQQIVKQDEIGDKNNVFSGTGYGFQIHICKDNHYRFDGAFGQLCLICPSKNISVIVFSQYSKTEVLLSLIYKYLFKEKCVFDIYNEIKPDSIIETVYEYNIPFNTYSLCKNDLGIKTIHFSKVNNEYQITINYEDYCNVINFSPEHSTGGEMNFIKDLHNHIQKFVCYTTLNENSLTLKLFLIETPYVAIYMFSFLENSNSLKLEFSINGSFTLKNETINGMVHPC